MQQKINAIARAIFLAFFGLSLLTNISAQTTTKETREAAERARQAAKVFNKIMDEADKAIPRELLSRAEAVAVFPGVLNAAFIVGGRGGEGVISRRTSAGWSAPAFFNLGGGSIGFQIGGEKIDYIMLFMNDGALKGLLEDKFELGGEANISAGPIGRNASATTNPTLDGGILSYSRSRGAFAGIALKGGVISPDKNRNNEVYGKTAKEILSGNSMIEAPENIKVFPQSLNRYSARKTAANTENTNDSRPRTAPEPNK